MYANLTVRVKRADGTTAEHAAWRVETAGEETIVHLDGNRNGNYAVEAGEVRYGRGDAITTAASW